METFPGAGQTVLLPLFHAGITGEQAFGPQGAVQAFVGLDESSGDAEPQGSSLSGNSASTHRSLNVVFAQHPGDFQGHADLQNQGFPAQVVNEFPAVDDRLAGPGL